MGKTRQWLLVCPLLLAACANQSHAPVDNLNPQASHSAPANNPAPAKSKVSLWLPLQGNFAAAGQAIRDGYLYAYYQNPQTSMAVPHVINSQSLNNVLALYQQTLTTDHPDLLVGPLTKNDANALAKEALLGTAVLALNRTDDLPQANNFYQFSLDPQAEARLVAIRLHQDGYQQVVVVAPSGEWGQSIAAQFGKAWLALGGQIKDSSTYQDPQQFTQSAQTLLDESKALDPKQTALFLVANAQDARLLVPMLRYQATVLPIYALPIIYSGVANEAANTALNEVIFPSTQWQLDSQSQARQAFAALYPDATEDALRLYGFGMDAYALSQYYVDHHGFNGLNLAGNSGQLTLAEHGVIERQLSWATFKQGKAIALS